jgi:hypothetical protein
MKSLGVDRRAWRITVDVDVVVWRGRVESTWIRDTDAEKAKRSEGSLNFVLMLGSVQWSEFRL